MKNLISFFPLCIFSKQGLKEIHSTQSYNFTLACVGSQYPLASVCVFVQTVALDIRLSLVCHLGQLRQNIFQLKFPLCSLLLLSGVLC